MRWIENWLPPFLVVSTSSITLQGLGKIEQRVPAVGAKMWCLYVSFVFLLRCRCAVRSRRQFEQLFCRRLWVDFDSVFIVFSQVIAFQRRQRVLIFVARWCHNFREIAVKKCEKSKNWRKSFFSPHCVQIAERFEENSTALVYGRECRCASYIFFRITLYSADNIVKVVSLCRQSKNGPG